MQTYYLPKYTFWFSAIFLSFVYIVVRFIEKGYHIKYEFNQNLELITYILLLLIIGFIVGFFSGNCNGYSGVWGKFKETTLQLFHNDAFKEAFEKAVCKHDNQLFSYSSNSSRNITGQNRMEGTELQALITGFNYLDFVTKNMVTDRLKRKISNNKYVANDKDTLRKILVALVEMFTVIGNENYRFRAALFVPDESSEFLRPLVAVPFENQPFLSLNDDLQNYQSNFSKSSQSIVSIAWQSMKVSYSGSEIMFFHEGQSEYLKSIIAFPIIIDQELQTLFNGIGKNFDKVMGIICLDCDNDFLSTKNREINKTLISSFANRIYFEMLFAVFRRKS